MNLTIYEECKIRLFGLIRQTNTKLLPNKKGCRIMAAFLIYYVFYYFETDIDLTTDAASVKILTL